MNKMKLMLIMAIISCLAVAWAGQASADSTANQCAYVEVYIEGPNSQDWAINKINCKHGHASKISDQGLLLGPVDNGIWGSGFYGPDCNVVIHKRTVSIINQDNLVYKVGKKYCGAFSKNTKTHISHESGPTTTYKVFHGSYHQDLPSTVIFRVP